MNENNAIQETEKSLNFIEQKVEEDLENGAVVKLKGIPDGEKDPVAPLLKVHSGQELPTKVFTAVRYRDHWFWIADDDPNSKRTFSYLSMLLAVTETDEKSGLQLVVPTN